jgi:hypothetical protein
MPEEMKKAVEEASKKAAGTVQVVSLPASADGKAGGASSAAGSGAKADGAAAAPAVPVVPVEYATKVCS